MRRTVLLLLVALGGCASHPKLVMLNPRTGQQVNCEMPDSTMTSGEFLVSRACLSACQAHGFRPIPGAASSGINLGTPIPCSE